MDKELKNWLFTYVGVFVVLNALALLAGMLTWSATSPIALFVADVALIVPVCVPLAVTHGADDLRFLASLSLAAGIYAGAIVVFAVLAALLGFPLKVVAAVNLVLVFAFVMVLRQVGAAAKHVDEVQGNGSEPRHPGTL